MHPHLCRFSLNEVNFMILLFELCCEERKISLVDFSQNLYICLLFSEFVFSSVRIRVVFVRKKFASPNEVGVSY